VREKRDGAKKEENGTYAISFSTAHANASDQPFRGNASHTDLIVSSCTYSENFPALSNSLDVSDAQDTASGSSPAIPIPVFVFSPHPFSRQGASARYPTMGNSQIASRLTTSYVHLQALTPRSSS
jgi:hypothetical protein